LEERTRELEASQRVTFAASERVSPDELLSLVVNLIRDQFNLYHVQVYIVDEDQGAAVLRESTGYAGRQLLQRGHHISLDSERSLVVKAILEGQPVLVDDVSRASDFMPNPLLPDTRSELVVPLKVGGRVLGALDAQDRATGRFSESTVALFQTMAEQVSFLFENSELLQRVTQQTESMTLFTNQLRTAADIARRLGTILDPEHLLGQVVEMMQSRFGLTTLTSMCSTSRPADWSYAPAPARWAACCASGGTVSLSIPGRAWWPAPRGTRRPCWSTTPASNRALCLTRSCPRLGPKWPCLSS
jgi:transcriptional regulator with GAF, ATPase, and Fis domain